MLSNIVYVVPRCRATSTSRLYFIFSPTVIWFFLFLAFVLIVFLLLRILGAPRARPGSGKCRLHFIYWDGWKWLRSQFLDKNIKKWVTIWWLMYEVTNILFFFVILNHLWLGLLILFYSINIILNLKKITTLKQR